MGWDGRVMPDACLGAGNPDWPQCSDCPDRPGWGVAPWLPAAAAAGACGWRALAEPGGAGPTSGSRSIAHPAHAAGAARSRGAGAVCPGSGATPSLINLLLAGLAQKPQTGNITLNADEHSHRPTTHGDPSPLRGALCRRVPGSGHCEPRRNRGESLGQSAGGH